MANTTTEKKAKRAISLISNLGLIYTGFNMEIAHELNEIRIEATVDTTIENTSKTIRMNDIIMTIAKIAAMDDMDADFYMNSEKQNTMTYTFTDGNLWIVLNVKADKE